MTVLLVEDDVAVRLLASRILRREGYSVLEASDGLDAVRIAQEHSGGIDVLLTDVIMPRMSGRELAEQLRADRPHLPVLFMSGYTGDALLRHGVLTSSAGFLQKPFTPAGLAQKVRELLEAV